MAGFTDEAEGIPYRSIPTAPTPDNEADRDEEDFSTLKEVQAILQKGLDELKFDLTEVNDENEDDLKVEVRSRKRARAIIEPAKQLVDSAIETVELKRKGKA